MALVLTVLMSNQDAGAKTVYWGRLKRTVALDPGHGGDDGGARSPDGILEKMMVLDLSRRLADQLSGVYRVTLTRSEDYSLDIPSRLDVANNIEADVLISLHAAGSFTTATKGICIYYFKETGSGARSGASLPEDSQNQLLAWDRLQLRHGRASQRLAQSLKGQLSPLSPVTLMAAPLLVLRGADMPAVMIEIGYLSNPEDVKALRDPVYLESLSIAISAGIDDFFSNSGQTKQ